MMSNMQLKKIIYLIFILTQYGHFIVENANKASSNYQLLAEAYELGKSDERGQNKSIIHDRDFNYYKYNHHQQQHEQDKIQNIDNRVIIYQLYHGLGTQYMDLYVGYPHPQRQSLILDTGSGKTALLCYNCPQCKTLNNYFQYDHSDTFQLIDCDDCKLGKCRKKRNNNKSVVDDDDDDDNNKHNSKDNILYSNSNTCKTYAEYKEESSWSAVESEDQIYLEYKLPNNDTRKKQERGLLNTLSLQNQNNSIIESIKSFRLRFSCQTSITGQFLKQFENGIVGFDRHKYSFWNQMYDQGYIQTKIFTICLSPVQQQQEQQSNAPNHELNTPSGIMALGGIEKSLHYSSIVYAYLMPKTTWYTIYVKAIYLELPDQPSNFMNQRNHDYNYYDYYYDSILYVAGDDRIDTKMHVTKKRIVRLEMDMELFNSGEIILDSGSTETLLPSIMKDPFQNAWLDLIGKHHDYYLPYDSHQDGEMPQVYPTILLQLRRYADGISEVEDSYDNDLTVGDLDPDSPTDPLIAIPPAHYMASIGVHHYGRLFLDEDVSDGGIIGAYAMMGYDIIHDMVSSRIGFAKSNCKYKKYQ